MQQFIIQLGIDWRLLLSQVVNFLLLLIVLRMFVYKPLLKIMRDRHNKIADGLAKAKEADKRLHEIDMIGKGKIKEAEQQALKIIQKAENDAKSIEVELLNEARRKEAEVARDSEATLKAKEAESRKIIEREAANLVRLAIIKTVQLDPAHIDDALIAQAVEEVKRIK